MDSVLKRQGQEKRNKLDRLVSPIALYSTNDFPLRGNLAQFRKCEWLGYVMFHIEGGDETLQRRIASLQQMLDTRIPE